MKKNKSTRSVFRGGSWININSDNLRGAFRYVVDNVSWDYNNGFRLVLISKSKRE